MIFSKRLIRDSKQKIFEEEEIQEQSENIEPHIKKQMDLNLSTIDLILISFFIILQK